MQYIITKNSRSSASEGYIGLTCFFAHVVHGKIYEDRESAQEDADKLTVINPVGFYVQEYVSKEAL